MRVIISIAAVAALAVLVAGKAQEGSRLQTGSEQGAEIPEELRTIMEKCRPLAERASPECQELRAKLTQMRGAGRGGVGPSDDDADDFGSGSGMRPRKGPKDGKRDGKGKKGKGKGKGKGGHEGGADHKAARGTGKKGKGKGKGGPEGNHNGEPQGQHGGGGGGGGRTHAEMAGAAVGVVGLIVVVVAVVVVAVRKRRRSRAPRLSLTNAVPGDCTKPPAYAANVPVVEATAVDYREVDGQMRVLNNANYARPASIC